MTPAAQARWRGADAAEEVVSTTMRLAEAEYRNAPLPVVLDHVRRLAGALDRYTGAAVRDALASGIGWDAIAAVTEVDVTTARATWGASQAQHTHPRSPRGEARGQAPAAEHRFPPPDAAPGATEADGRRVPASAERAARDVAAALTRLRGASGSTLTHAASRAGLTPSYVSLVLSGEVRPPWAVVAVLAQVFAGEPEDLLPLWRDAQATLPPPGSTAAPAEKTRGRAPTRIRAPRERTPDASADVETGVPRGGPLRIETENPRRPETDR